MPKILFYIATAFCLFLALISAEAALVDVETGKTAFMALGGTVGARGAWAILVALVAGVAAAALFVRMATLVAARNLFAAFIALFSIAGALASLVWVAMLQSRILILAHARAVADAVVRSLGEMHLAACLMLGYFVSLAFLSLRPYFRVQASRVLSALVFLPLPVMFLIVAQELFVRPSSAPLPASSPAVIVYFGILSVLFFAIAVHCVRHRYLFLEMTNLRELLDSRMPASPGQSRSIGSVAFDS